MLMVIETPMYMQFGRMRDTNALHEPLAMQKFGGELSITYPPIEKGTKTGTIGNSSETTTTIMCMCLV